MKIDIGPYRSDIIPVRNWERSYEFSRSGTGYLREEDYTWYDKIIMGFFDKLGDLVQPLNRWSNNRPRKIKIRVDGYDVWSADHTLAMIIAPTLKKLKEVQHGYPHVDNEDVPEELRFVDPVTSNEYSDEIDDKHQARWAWVLDEMIWTFDQYGDHDDADQYYYNTDQLEMISVPSETHPELKSISFNHQKDPSKPAYFRDEEGLQKHHERKKNGLRLFAKYYESLWD